MIAHKGFVWADDRDHRQRRRMARCAEVGIDAIAKMGPILTGIGELDRELRAGTRHPLLGTGLRCTPR